MLASGVLVQENLDVKPYEVDNKYYVAYYPANYYKQKYYNGISQPMKIYKQNSIHNEIKSSKITFTYQDSTPIKIKNSKVNFLFYLYIKR